MLIFELAASASFIPSHADSLNEPSLIPPVSVTMHALNPVAAPADTVAPVAAITTVPSTSAEAPSNVETRRILSMNISLIRLSTPEGDVLSFDVRPTQQHHTFGFVIRETTP